MKNIFVISLLFCSGICKGQDGFKLRIDTTVSPILKIVDTGFYTTAFVKNDTLHVVDSLKTIQVLLKLLLDKEQKKKSEWYLPLKFEDIKYPKNSNSQDSSYAKSRSIFEKERGIIIFCKDCKSNEGKLGVKQIWDGSRWVNLE